MIQYIEYLGLPLSIGIAIVGAILFMNLVGELLEFKGKVVPEFMKIRKYFSRKKKEREETAQTLKEVKQLLADRDETAQTMKEVKVLLADVNAHYSADNIAKRDSWMEWVNSRAEVYDTSIEKISQNLAYATEALKDNTKMTEEIFVQNSRDRIIDFANRVCDTNIVVSREEFNRIFKVYKRYEDFLNERHMTNGEIDIAYRMIVEAYEHRMKHHSFTEDVRGYIVE